MAYIVMGRDMQYIYIYICIDIYIFVREPNVCPTWCTGAGRLLLHAAGGMFRLIVPTERLFLQNLNRSWAVSLYFRWFGFESW